MLTSPDSFLVNLSGADSLASGAGYVAMATGAFVALAPDTATQNLMAKKRLVYLGVDRSAFMATLKSRNRAGLYNPIVKLLCTAPQEKTHECLFVGTSPDADTQPLSKALSKIRLFFNAQTAASYSDVVAPVDITQRSDIESALNRAKLGMSGQLSAADVVAVAQGMLAGGCATCSSRPGLLPSPGTWPPCVRPGSQAGGRSWSTATKRLRC